LQHLHEDLRKLFAEAATEIRQRVVIRMLVAGDETEGQRVILQTAVAGSAERRNASIGAAFRAIPGTAEQFQMGDRPSSGILRRSSNLANFDGANCRF
jgi:hypothetical protein